MKSYLDGRMVVLCDGCWKPFPLTEQPMMRYETTDGREGHTCSKTCQLKFETQPPLPFRCMNCVKLDVEVCEHRGAVV